MSENSNDVTPGEMELGSRRYTLAGNGNGLYRRSAPALVAVGRWGLSFRFEPPGRTPFDVVVLDRVTR